MKRNQMLSRIGGSILGFWLLFGVGIALSTAVQAQTPDDRRSQDGDRNGNADQNPRGRNWDRYGNYGGSYQLRQTALNAGYNEGVKQGVDDRNRHRSNFRDQSTYQRAIKDYNPRLGDRELYRRYFREGYENGYNADNYDRRDKDDVRFGGRNANGNQKRRGRSWDDYGNYGGSFQLRQTALNAGYNEGIKQGRGDRTKRNPSDYRGGGAYEKATKDYSSGLGDRELYRRYYREAYENGYDAGVNGY